MLILTPNRRLAAFSLQQYNKNCLAHDAQAWVTPQIYPLETWLNELWLRCSAYRPILSINQQQLLFEQIIQDSDQGVELLRIAPTAKNVIQAWKFLKQWQVPYAELAAYANYSLDTGALYVWLNTYQEWLAANDRVDFQLAVDSLLTELPRLAENIPRKIVLRGIQDLPPQYVAVFALLAEQGIEIVTDQLLEQSIDVCRSGFANATTELHAAAAWAAAQYHDRIGVVVPNLESQRSQVASVFAEYIPSIQLNISAPHTLMDYTIIDTALLILQQAKPILDYADISRLLRSPYINTGCYDPNQLALLDRCWRKQGLAKISFNKKTNTTLHNATYWASIMRELLNSWGWPGNQALNTQEADLVSCWRDLLVEYTKMEPIIGEHSYTKALLYVQQLATATPFLPAEQGATRVHVLGMLEAEGIPFDKLWVMGMTRESWPMLADPNPFIPLEIQRKYNMPRSSPQRELEVAERLTENLQQGGKYQVVFSYPEHVDDAAGVVSNLLVDLPEVNIPTAPVELQSANLERFIDDYNIPLSSRYVRGGTQVIKLQAQCPFKANATLRMAAEALEEPAVYLNAAQRGVIVHEILELYYLDETNTALSDIVDQVLTVWRKQYPLLLSANYYNLERTRLNNLLQRWLNYEQKREQFTVVQLEKKHPVQIGPLNINIKVDRVDRLADGSHLVIDYKTGSVQPLDPQLTIYARYVTPDAAIYYVKADKIKLQEYSAKEELDVEGLALEFAHGFAKVQPASPQICSTCDLHGLCRIYDN